MHNFETEQQQKVLYVTLSKFNFENALRELLLVQNFRIEVYIRPSIDDNWQLEYRGSPGNLLQFEEILFSNREILVGNTVISVQINKDVAGSTIVRKLGVAAVEPNDCRFQLLEFVDNDFFTELEACLVLLGPKECLLPSFDGEYETVKTLVERNSIMPTLFKGKTCGMDKHDIYQDLNRLLCFEKGQQEDAQALPEMELSLARESLRLAIKYLSLTNDAANLGKYKLHKMNLNRFVHLDSAAVTALNLLPKSDVHVNSSAYRWSSILGVLDRCLTPQGHRLITQWVKQPLRNIDILMDRHNIVQALLEDNETLDTLRSDALKRIPDILMLTNKLMRKKANLQDLVRIYATIKRMPKIVSLLLMMQDVTVKNVLAKPLQQQIDDLKGLLNMVELTVDLETIDKGEYLVKPSFDDKLDELKHKMDDLLERMQRLRGKAAQDLGFDQIEKVRLENVSHLGYIFRIVLKDDAALRKNKNYKVLDAIRGGVRFTSDKLTELSEKFKSIREDYEEHQSVIVDEVIKVASGYAIPLTLLNNEVAHIDCLVSLAIAARDAPVPYVRPKILAEGSGVLILKDLRHPCLELQENMSFIPNDVEFNKDVCNMYIITGPNMGGKSTYIRSAGVAVLMALIGSFVPCSSANISIVDCILGRIGATDNQSRGVSTFMLEMVETSAILRTATDKSLVVIDELGRGTSTNDGCGIAYAIAEHLVKEIKCFTLFSTHFHEVTKLAESNKSVKNYHMTAIADDQNFTLLYQVRPGVCQRSFGIQVARLAGVPAEVINFAKRVYNEFEMEEDDELLPREWQEAAHEFMQNPDMPMDALKKIVSSYKPKIAQGSK